MNTRRIAIFASGSGTNAENIIRYFQSRQMAEVALVLTNRRGAGVIDRARKFKIPVHVFRKESFYGSDEVLDILKSNNIDFIVLAGFLLLVPGNLLNAYPQRIVNIHPALLPNYGGKGMYGMHVHEAVKQSNDAETGITIHYVNREFDRGEIIFQERCKVQPTDTPLDIAAKVHELEYAHFPRVIEKLVARLEDDTGV